MMPSDVKKKKKDENQASTATCALIFISIIMCWFGNEIIILEKEVINLPGTAQHLLYRNQYIRK